MRGTILIIIPIFGIRVSLKENLVADALPHRRKEGDLLPLGVGQQQPDLSVYHHIEVLQAIRGFVQKSLLFPFMHYYVALNRLDEVGAVNHVLEGVEVDLEEHGMSEPQLLHVDHLLRVLPGRNRMLQAFHRIYDLQVLVHVVLLFIGLILMLICVMKEPVLIPMGLAHFISFIQLLLYYSLSIGDVFRMMHHEIIVVGRVIHGVASTSRGRQTALHVM